MAYRADVRYIEAMQPKLVDMAAEEFKRVMRLIESALPTLEEVKRTTVWSGTAKELFDRRLKEVDEMMEALHAGYRKAGQALDDYVEAQIKAQGLVAEGIRVEGELGNLIKHIRDPGPEPMKGWEDLRAKYSELAQHGEIAVANQIGDVQRDADRLFHEAAGFYGRAISAETTGRAVAGSALGTARGRLPDFVTTSADAPAIIGAISGLQQEIYQAAGNLDARRPVPAVMAHYQVVADPRTEMFPGPPLGWYQQERVTRTEADVLREIGADYNATIVIVKAIADEARAEADARFPVSEYVPGTTNVRNYADDGDDDHNDAFRHAYGTARLTQVFGEDWAHRFTTAHETVFPNPGAREAMDLYNNEVGRAIAMEDLLAPPEVLADKVQEAVQQGRTVVVGRDKQLDYSDQLTPADTGTPHQMPLPGHPMPKKTES